MAKYLIEVLTLITVFAFSFKQITFQKLLIDKICLNEFNFSKYICTNLSNYHNEEEKIQSEVNNYQLYMSIIVSILNVIYIVFLGPWSDIHGRKMLILLSLFGFLLENIVIFMNIIWFDISINYLLLAAICPGIMGGLIGLTTGTYSYVSDISVEKSRTLKFTILEILVKFSSPTGTIAGGFIYYHLHYYGIFGISTGLFLISVIISLFLKESLAIENHNVEISTTKSLKDIFNINNVKDMICNCWYSLGKKEILLLFSMFVGVICYVGVGKIDFLYSERMFGWSVPTYSLVNSLFSFGSCITSVTFVYIIIKIFYKSDAFLGLIGHSSSILENIIKSVATRKEIYYAASACGMLSSFCSVAIRILLSKFVSSRHIGSVFSLLAICESTTPLFAGIVFLETYNLMYRIFAGFVYIIAAFLSLIGFFTFVWLIKKMPTYESLNTFPITQECPTTVQYADECAIF
ncbi:probable peptidoglycan muropeptide transporter SLC46 [Centruroides vittatus]|uniref:probable peptidoglycan muropeptide transporter SLC46 n=1 Tax=Centruroides vittatus TaxID=120091 RepID=UPI003510C60F